MSEVDPLNFPIGATVVDQNMNISTGGKRSRRKGLSVYRDDPQDNTYGTGFYPVRGDTWEVSPGNRWFYIVVTNGTIEGWKIAFYSQASNGFLALRTIVDTRCDPAIAVSGRKAYYTISEGLGVLDRNTLGVLTITEDSVTTVNQWIEVRDIWGVPSPNEYERPLVDSLTGEARERHEYNLSNQGWPIESLGLGYPSTPEDEDPIIFLMNPRRQLRSENDIDAARFPSNRDLYPLFKADQARNLRAVGVFYPSDASRIAIPSSAPARGAHILDFKLRSATRTYITGESLFNLPDDTSIPLGRHGHLVQHLALYAGRVFYSFSPSAVVNYSRQPANSLTPPYSQFIGYSQSLEGDKNASRLYTEASPVDDIDNEVADTDGGLLQSEHMGEVIKMVPFGASLYFFTHTGIWELYAEGGRFTPTTYAFNKISNVIVTSPESIKVIKDAMLFASFDAIYSISSDPVSLRGVVRDFSSERVRRIYTSLSLEEKRSIHIAWDEQEDEILFFYERLTPVTSGGVTITRREPKALVFNSTYGIWRQNVYASPVTRYGSAADPTSSFNSRYQILLSYTDISQPSTPLVVLTAEHVSRANGSITSLSFLHRLVTSEVATQFDDNWSSYPVFGVPIATQYGAELQTGFITGGAPSERKTITGVVTVMCERTERGYTTSGSGAISFTHTSSCLTQGLWDWHTSGAINKWTPVREAYKLPNRAILSGGVADFGTSIIKTKMRMRGRGDSIALRFTSNGNLDLRFLGFGMEMTSNEKF